MSYVKIKSGGRRHMVGSFAAGADMRFDEGVTPEGYAVTCKNYKFDSGALTDGYGLETDSLYDGFSVWSVWDFERYDFNAGGYVTIKMLCDSRGQVWHNSDGWVKLPGAVFTSPPDALVYRLYGDDTVIMTTATDDMIVWKGVGAPQVIENSPRVTSFAMHYERMFATTAGEQNAVCYSDDLDPTNWNETLSEGGYIQLLDERGKLLKVVDFLNYVYIFREYGISRLSAYADQQDFQVVNLYVAGGRITPGSVCQCGGNVMLLGSDGLYCFDGYDMSRRLKNICFEPSPAASAVYADNKYYLAARVKGFGGNEGENNALVVYDLSGGGYSVSGLNLTRLMTADHGVYALTGDGLLGKVTDCGALFGHVFWKDWASGYSDFGSPGKKTLKELTVITEKLLVLTVTADGETHNYVIEGGGLPTRIKPCIAAHRFGFRLTSTLKGANVKRLSYVLQ